MTSRNSPGKEIFLPPGGFHFGKGDCTLRTIVGSCVAITLWHPVLHVGGMCHYMLPARLGLRRRERADGRYADEAMELFLIHIAESGTRPADYQVRFFGGASIFGVLWPIAVGDRNIEAGQALLRRHGFAIACFDLAGARSREIIFDLASGSVLVRPGVEARPPVTPLALRKPTPL